MTAKYPLQGLLQLRSRRREDAERAVREKKQLLAAAVQKEEQAKAELENFKIWKQEETDRRYEAIMGKIMKQNKIEQFNADLKNLDVQEGEKASALAERQKETAEARTALKDALDELQRRFKGEQKLERHKAIWGTEQRKHEEYLSEQELEDFSVKKQNAG